jgi:quercetin dioxygenase-like cupin family protein
MRSLVIFAAMVVALSGFQDPVAVNPKIVTVVFENERVRVLRVHFGPHDRLELHSHPALVVLSMTNGSRRVYSADGSHRDTSATPGEVQWREPSTHAVENLIDDPSENIEIELKKTAAAAVAAVPSKVSLSSEDLLEPVPVQNEPHHHSVLENQYVRVLDVSIAAGESTLFHTHEHDNLSIRVSGGQAQTQLQGSDWRPASQVERGSVVFSSASSKPYTHRVKNVGPDTYRVIDIELLP